MYASNITLMLRNRTLALMLCSFYDYYFQNVEKQRNYNDACHLQCH